MVLTDKLDELGKPAWIAATIVAFCVWWPLGLAMMAYMFTSGRMRAWRCGGGGVWHSADGAQSAPPRWRTGRMRRTPTGNWAFDDYRAETIRRLEQEQQEFAEYLERLRRARDKQEFDSFMADRGRRDDTTPAETT